MEGRSIVPPPLIEVAIEPKTRSDREHLLAALARLVEPDPAFSYTVDSENGQILIRGANELHLEAKIDALNAEDGLRFHFGGPQVAYRETISRAVTIDYTHMKPNGASGQFARVVIAFEPRGFAEGFTFVNAVTGDSIPGDWIPGVENGLTLQSQLGLLAGFPLIGVKATLLDGAYHDMDSNILTFEIAARAALRELAQKGRPVLLQPIMSVTIEAPLDARDALIADLDLRSADIETTLRKGEDVLIKAEAPLANLFGYVNAVSAITQGLGRFALTFARYAQAPPNVADPDDDPRFPPAMGARAIRLDIA